VGQEPTGIRSQSGKQAVPPQRGFQRSSDGALTDTLPSDQGFDALEVCEGAGSTGAATARRETPSSELNVTVRIFQGLLLRLEPKCWIFMLGTQPLVRTVFGISLARRFCLESSAQMGGGRYSRNFEAVKGCLK
jgi:hypothetical protein